MSLREAWESQAANWTAWARQAGHDSFQRGYADDVERDGLKMTFHSDHHSLEAFARALEDAGLLIEAIREIPRPGSSWQWRPEDERWRRIPYFLHFRAVRQ